LDQVLLLFSFYYLPSQDALLKEHFSGIIKEPLPKVIDLIHAVDLVLLNTHPAIQLPRAQAPNSIEVGGMHLRTQDDQIHPVSHTKLIHSLNVYQFTTHRNSLKSWTKL
jgi:hypothetical protein